MGTKLAAAVVVAGTISLASLGVAVAAPPLGAGASTVQATKAVRCAHAPRALARIAKAEGRMAQRLAKLQTAEHTAQTSGHPKVAQRIQKRIDRLGARQTKGNDRRARIEAACPGVAP
jgi:hypothetical protein